MPVQTTFSDCSSSAKAPRPLKSCCRDSRNLNGHIGCGDGRCERKGKSLQSKKSERRTTKCILLASHTGTPSNLNFSFCQAVADIANKQGNNYQNFKQINFLKAAISGSILCLPTHLVSCYSQWGLLRGKCV